MPVTTPPTQVVPKTTSPLPAIGPTTRGQIKKAVFFTPTHFRPEILRAALKHITTQTIPDGWTVEVLVAGQPNDPGRAVALSFPWTRYIEVPTAQVTDKLNACLQATDAELVLLADDDDLQLPGRLASSVRAYMNGADWSGAGTVLQYDLKHDRVMRWSGQAQRGLVGTTLSFSMALLRVVRGWPPRPKGKDGPMALQIQRCGRAVVFTDLTSELEGTLTLQHGMNIWPRPILEKGGTSARGGFSILGMGTAQEAGVSQEMRDTLKPLQAVLQPPKIPVVDVPPAAPSIVPGDTLNNSLFARRGFLGVPVTPPAKPLTRPTKAIPPPFVDLPPQLVAVGPLVTCTPGAHGQLAFVDGLKSLGFELASPQTALVYLTKGTPVLFHGWRPEFRKWGKQHPGKVFVLWHSGWTGSDLMGEGLALGQAIEASKAGEIKLLWLDRRDLPPPGGAFLAPVWDGGELQKLTGEVPPLKIPNSILLGFHTDWPSLCKNSLAAVAACVKTGASLHLSQSALKSARGDAVRRLLEGTQHQIHATLVRSEAVRLAASVEVVVHPSLSDTWPYFVMEAVYAGTPVVVTDAIAWTEELPDWAKNLCVVRPATSVAALYEKVNHLLHSPEDRTRLVKAQQDCLNQILPKNKEYTLKALRDLGFPLEKSSPVQTLPAPATPMACPEAPPQGRGCFLIDVPDWAFNFAASGLNRILNGVFDILTFAQINKSLAQYDIVYSLSWHQLYKALPFLKSGCHTIMYVSDEVTWGTSNKYFMAAVTRADLVVASSEKIVEKLRKEIGIPTKVRLLPEGIDTDLFNPEGRNSREEQLVVGWAGSTQHFRELKGFDLIKAATSKLPVRLEITDRMQNFRPPHLMPEWYRSLDVYACMSRAEGLPRPVMEALACGCQVVSTEVGIVPELKQEGASINIIERTEEALEQALRDLTPLSPEEAQANYQIIRKRWDIRSRRPDFFRLLEEVGYRVPPAIVGTTSPSPSGGASFTLNLLSALERCGFRWKIGADYKLASGGVFPTIDIEKCGTVQPGQVIINNLSRQLFGKLALPPAAKVITVLHTDVQWTHDFFQHTTKQIGGAQRYDAILAVDHTLPDYLLKLGVPSHKIHRVDLQAESNFRSPIKDEIARARQRFGVRCPKVISYVGRFSNEKRIPSLIEMLAPLLSTSEYELLLIGGNPHISNCVPDMQRHINSLGLQTTVRIVGPVTENREAFYWASDCVVLNSDFEALPYTLLEALQCGTPFVSPALGRIPELADKSKGGTALPRKGLVFDAHEKEEFLEAVKFWAKKRTTPYINQGYTIGETLWNIL